MNIQPAITDFDIKNIINGFTRPSIKSNAWIAALEDEYPELILSWSSQQTVKGVTLYFDTDFDHPMESVQMGHPESRIPFCIRNFKLLDEKKNLIAEVTDNYQTICRINFSKSMKLNQLVLQMERSENNIPCSLFQIYIEGDVG